MGNITGIHARFTCFVQRVTNLAALFNRMNTHCRSRLYQVGIYMRVFDARNQASVQMEGMLVEARGGAT